MDDHDNDEMYILVITFTNENIYVDYIDITLNAVHDQLRFGTGQLQSHPSGLLHCHWVMIAFAPW